MISEKEFQALLKKNPQIKAKYQKKLQEEKQRKTNRQEKIKNQKFSNPLKGTKQPEDISVLMQEEHERKLNKYFNVKVYEYENGLIAEDKTIKNAGKVIAVYDSRKEYNRWCELQLLQKAGRISGLQRQVHMLIQESFMYQEEKISAIEYVADFIYTERDNTVIEDVKPLDPKTRKHRFTKDFALKWKLLKHRYPEYKFAIF